MPQLRTISRRSILRGVGATMALPYLEAMADAPAASAAGEPPRLACFYVPGCIACPAWFPADEGPGYTLSPTLQEIERHRAQFTVISGLQHFAGRIDGHAHAVNWLTGHNVLRLPGFPNTVSFDQIFARHFGDTYLPTMALSHTSGVGVNTLSRDALGSDIPAVAEPARVFERLFPPADAAQVRQAQLRLSRRQSVLDALGESLRALDRDLGQADRHRMQQYTQSVRDLEQQIHTRQRVLAQTQRAPRRDRAELETPTGDAASWRRHIEVMMDLIVLGFQTDMTRTATYTLGDEAGPHYREYAQWMQRAGFDDFVDVHYLHHQATDFADGRRPIVKTLALRDAMLVRCLGRLMDKLQAIPVADGTLLDHTQILFGGAQARTHVAANMPLLVAGGKKLGWKHGRHVRYVKPRSEVDIRDTAAVAQHATTPLSNLLLTLLQQAGCPAESFNESTGVLSELLT